ncbi:hypothetical protein KAT55_06760 [Candidatus Bathyarchaeota archaeon]|jgi:hypothetical protein|nr:hypothetical protein [Candidatus Bathyarchaeota archaeon]
METRLESTSGRIAFFAVMAALTTIANLIMVPMPQPLAEYDLSPVLTYTLGVTVDPVTAAVIVATAMMLGTGYKVMTFGFPIVFVPGAMLVRGLEAALISVIVRMKPPAETKTVTTWEILAMVVGVVFETLGFFVLDWYLFGWAIALTVLPTIVDAVFIPVAIGVIAAVRGRLGVIRLF